MVKQVDISNLKYEQALQELEKVITDLEQGTLELEEMIQRFEAGKALLAHCQALLDKAELRVREVGQFDKNTTDNGDET